MIPEDTDPAEAHAANDTNYNHPRDKKVTFTAYCFRWLHSLTDGVMFTAREDESAIGPLSLSIDPPGVDANATGGQDVTLTVTLEKAPGQDDARSASGYHR